MAVPVYCICKQAYDKTRAMFQCPSPQCQQWFHFDCLKIPYKAEIFANDIMCPLCTRVNSQSQIDEESESNGMCDEESESNGMFDEESESNGMFDEESEPNSVEPPEFIVMDEPVEMNFAIQPEFEIINNNAETDRIKELEKQNSEKDELIKALQNKIKELEQENIKL
eukprot:97834_1